MSLRIQRSSYTARRTCINAALTLFGQLVAHPTHTLPRPSMKEQTLLVSPQEGRGGKDRQRFWREREIVRVSDRGSGRGSFSGPRYRGTSLNGVWGGYD